MLEFTLKEQGLELLPEKAIFWKDREILLIGDTHFGKVNHFRKSGISIPDGAAMKNLEILRQLISKTKAKEVIFLGDLFHSEMNSEWLFFKEILNSFPEIKFKLVQGNHDIFHEMTYQKGSFEFFDKPLEIGPFVLSHEPMEGEYDLYNLCGHIHPGVRLKGAAKQSLRLPCFYFQKTQGILPAFGQFTGLFVVRPKKKDRVFVIVESKVIEVS